MPFIFLSLASKKTTMKENNFASVSEGNLSNFEFQPMRELPVKKRAARVGKNAKGSEAPRCLPAKSSAEAEADKTAFLSLGKENKRICKRDKDLVILNQTGAVTLPSTDKITMHLNNSEIHFHF